MNVQRTQQIRRILAVLILGSFIALIVTVLVRQFRTSPAGVIAKPVSPGVDMSLTNPRFSEFKGSSKIWELVAEQAEYDKDTGLALLSKVTAQLQESSAGSVTLSAEKGSYHEPSKLVKLRDKVHAVSKRGMTFDTSRLEYRITPGLIVSDQPVQMSDGRLSLQAQGIEMLVEQETAHFTGPVTAVIEGYNVQR